MRRLYGVDTQLDPLHTVSQKLCEGVFVAGVVHALLIPTCPTSEAGLWIVSVHANYFQHTDMSFLVAMSEDIFWSFLGGTAGEIMPRNSPQPVRYAVVDKSPSFLATILRLFWILSRNLQWDYAPDALKESLPGHTLH